MDGLWVLLGLVGLAYLVAPIAAFVMALGNRARLHDLDRRISELARKVVQAAPAPPRAETPAPAAVAPTPVTPASVTTAPDTTAPVVAAPAAPTPPASQPVSESAPPSDAKRPVAETLAASTPAASSPSAARPPTLTAAQPVVVELFEQRFGTRWVVWIGGVALALGGIFLVNYAVEQGYFGPGVRILLASILAVLLIAAGEWARRTERVSGLIGIASAHVPSVLTAAGTIVAFATAYAAFALYGFIGPAAAFVLLGAIGIVTLAAALLHGPALAALGLVGAQATPLLVTTPTPNYWALYIYLAVVTAAAFALARARLVALACHLDRRRRRPLWVLPGIDDIGTLAPHAFHVAAGLALVAVFIVAGLWLGPPRACPAMWIACRRRACRLSAGRRAARRSQRLTHDSAMLVFTVLTAATVAIAWRAEAALRRRAALRPSSPRWSWFTGCWRRRTCFSPRRRPDGSRPHPPMCNGISPTGSCLPRCSGLTGFLTQGRSTGASVPIRWATASVFAPLAILAALYYRIAGFERSIPFAAWRCCWPRCSRSRPRCWRGARRGRATRPRRRSTPPAPSPRWHSRSPSRWRRAG